MDQKNQPVAATIDIEKIIVDDSYQRTRNLDALHKKIAAAFSWEAFGRPLISRRNTDHGLEYYVIDGQQRIKALRSLGHKGKIPVLFVENGTQKEEAELFSKINSDRVAVSALERFTAAVTSGREPEKSMQEFFDQQNMIVTDSSSKDRGVKFVTKIRKSWLLDMESTKRALRASMMLCDGGNLHIYVFSVCFALLRRGIPIDDPAICRRIYRRLGRESLIAALSVVPRSGGAGSSGCPVAMTAAMLDIVNYGRHDRYELGSVSSAKPTSKQKGTK